MGFAFELYFDRQSEQVLRGIWRRLLAMGLLSVDLQDDAKPHISLSVCDDLDPSAGRLLVDEFCVLRRRFRVQLGFIGTFMTGENVIFVAPSMTEELRHIHQDFHDRLQARGFPAWEHYRPGSWQPHCTMAIGVAESAYLDAFATIRAGLRPLAATVESMGLVEFRPARLLHERSLSD